jgi:hypothetical protein
MQANQNKASQTRQYTYPLLRKKRTEQASKSEGSSIDPHTKGTKQRRQEPILP